MFFLTDHKHTPMIERASSLNNSFLFGVSVLIWGSTWFTIEFQLGVVEPEVSIVYRYIAAALSAIAFSSMLWMNTINARLLFGVRVSARTYLGALLGTAGIVALFGPQISDVSLSDGVFFGSVLAVIGALLASFGNMASQAAQKNKLPVVQSNAWSMLYGGLLTGVLALALGFSMLFEGMSLDLWIGAGFILVLTGNVLVLKTGSAK